jgi:hypothetical protein
MAPLTKYLETGDRKKKLGFAATLAAGLGLLAGAVRLLRGRREAS